MIMKNIRQLIEEALDAEREFDSLTDAEPRFLLVLEAIQADTHAAEEAEALLLEAVEKRRDCRMLLTYLMAELRWPKVLAKVKEAGASDKTRELEFYFDDVVSAYGDPEKWYWSIFFDRYRRAEEGGSR